MSGYDTETWWREPAGHDWATVTSYCPDCGEAYEIEILVDWYRIYDLYDKVTGEMEMAASTRQRQKHECCAC